MKLWRLVEPLDTTFARASLRSPGQLIVPPLCEYCGYGAKYAFPKPLTIEWSAGSDIVGDFLWPGGGRIAARRNVCDELSNKFGSVCAESIAMMQDPKLKQPKRKTTKASPRVWLPYGGPELVELWVEQIISYLPKTTTEDLSRCSKCGRVGKRITGVEEKAHRWDKEKHALVACHWPRIPGEGVFVARSELLDRPIFRLDGFEHFVLCTDEVKAYIQEQNYRNIDFSEFGSAI